MSLRDEWLADPEPISFAEWLRQRTVPAGLLAPPPPAPAPVQPPARKAVSYPPGVNPNGQPLVHGSTRGWKRHKAAGEDPCDVCEAGHEAEKERRAADKRALRASRRATALVLLTLVALLGLAVPAQAAAPKQVLVLGDSIVGGASNYINFYLSHDGRAQTTIRSVGGTAICDVLPGSGGPWTVNGLLAAKRYDAVIVAFSGNAMSKCMGGLKGQAVVDKYRADTATVMRTAQQYGVPNVVWVQPPAAASADLNYVRSGLGQVYGELPASWPTARVVDGGAGVDGAAERFAPMMPCASWDVQCYLGWVRIGADDGVHLWCGKRGPSYYGIVPPCDTYSPGSNRYGMNLAATREFIGL